MLNCSLFGEAQSGLVQLGLGSEGIREVLAALRLLGGPIRAGEVLFGEAIGQTASIAFSFPCLPRIMRPSEAGIPDARLFLMFAKRAEVLIDALLFSLIVLDQRK